MGTERPISPCPRSSSSAPPFPARPANGTTTTSTFRRRHRGRPHHEGGGSARKAVLDVDARLRISRGPHTDARRGDARGRDGGVRKTLAAGVVLRSGGRSAFGTNPKTCAHSEPYRF